VLVVATVLSVGPNVVTLPYSDAMNAIAVLGLAAGAALVGTADDGRPVCQPSVTPAARPKAESRRVRPRRPGDWGDRRLRADGAKSTPKTAVGPK
jgi:hypothetical protein